MRAVRVCGRTYSPTRASGRPNRWNAAGELVLYLAEHFATAILESVVQAGAAPPPPVHAAWATIPDDLVEELSVAKLPKGWDNLDDYSVARAIGSHWYAQTRSAVLIVPSVPGRPFERNLVINTTHAGVAKILWETPIDIPWDPRLFS